MDQRTMVARSHGSYNIAMGSSLQHSHYPPQQSQPQAQPVQPQVQQLQQQPVHQGQQPPSVPQQQRPPAPINVQSPTRPFYQPSQDAPDALEESLKRTVKIVYWYKAGHEPIRLHQEISTFPFVRLSMFQHLVSDLGLTGNSLVDAYDPEYQTWGQQHIMTVQTVKFVPRLLYRARKSLLEGLSDHECPGLDHELRLQHTRHSQPSPTVTSPGSRPLKRPAPDSSTVDGTANKHFRTNSQGYIAQHANGAHGTPTFASSVPAHATAHAGPSGSGTPLAAAQIHNAPNSPSLQSPYLQRDDALHPSSECELSSAAPAANGHLHALPSAAAASGASGANPPLKRWPNDYAVCEIAEGFRKMDGLIRETPALTQRAAFEQVFGCRYVKSTVCRHRGVWKRADKGLKDAFERLGTTEAALWGEFVKKTDFRREGQRVVKGQQDDEEEVNAMNNVRMDYTASMGQLGLGMLAGDDQQRPPMASLVPPSA